MKGYTIQHSIDLLENSVEDLESRPTDAPTAAQVSYDNTDSHLTADDVQEAIDELTTMISSINPLDEYSTTEKVVGKWIDDRDVYEKVVNFGALPNATTKSVAHGITDLDYCISVSAVASNSEHSNFVLPLVQPETTAIPSQIGITLNATNINIYSGADRSGYTSCYVVLRYVKVAPQTNTRKRTKKTEEE